MVGRSPDFWEGYLIGFKVGMAQGRNEGFAQGENATIEYFNRYFLPLMLDVRGLYAILTNIWGCIGNGTTEVAREQLRVINDDLAGQIGKVLNSYAVAGLPRPNLSYAATVFETVENFLRREATADDLRALLAKGIPEFEGQLTIREQLRPGRKQGDATKKLDVEAFRLLQEGFSYQEVINKLYANAEFAAVIDGWLDPVERLGDRMKDYRRKSKIGGVVSKPPHT